MTDIIAMSQSCSKCGQTVTNNMPEIRHPLDFLQALRDRGWFIPDIMPAKSEQLRKPHLCPKCVAQGG